MMSCGSSRKAVSSEKELRIEGLELRDSVVVLASRWWQASIARAQSLVVLDTLKEITTITVDRNDKGDTLKLVQITDRTRATDRAAARDKEEKLIVRTDTVYIEKRDSVDVKNTSLTKVQLDGPKGKVNPSNKKSNFVSSLKWIFWILVVATVLIVVLRIGRKGIL